MKVLVVGSGGREHAVIRKLKESRPDLEILCAPGNGGIAADAECVDVKATDVEGMVALSKERGVDYVVVTPDDPLALGMVDALSRKGGDAWKGFRLVATGGFAKWVLKDSGMPFTVDATLTLHGAGLLASRSPEVLRSASRSRNSQRNMVK